MTRSERERVADILEAIDLIESWTAHEAHDDLTVPQSFASSASLARPQPTSVTRSGLLIQR